MMSTTFNYQVGIDTNIEGPFDIHIYIHALLIHGWYKILAQNIKFT
jgi:hypothetical protein